MANIKNFGLVGVGSQVQFGKAGPQLINNSGVFAFRDKGNTADADITAGNLILSGSLQVNGTTTTVNTTNVTTADKQFILSNGATEDSMADGSGIVVQGASAHSILFDNANAAFTTTDNFNLVTGKQYEIAGVPVLTATALGSAIVSSSLTSVGDLTSLHVVGTSALDGAVTAGSTLAVTGNTTVGGTLGVTGASTLAATTIAGGLTVDTVTASGAVSTGALTASDLTVTKLADANATGARSVTIDANGNFQVGEAADAVSAQTVTADHVIGTTDGTFGDIVISGDTIATKTADANLVLAPNGAGIVTAPALTATGVITAGSFSTTGTLAAGATTVTTIDATGAATMGAGLGVTGGTTTDTLTVTGASTLAGVTAGDISAASITTTGNGSIGGTFTATGAATFNGGATIASGAAVTGGLTSDTLTVSGAVSTGALTAASVTASNLTEGQVVFAGTAGALTDSAALTFNSTTGVLTATGFATSGLTIGATMLTGLAAPQVDADAANKAYVDSEIASHVSAGVANAGRAAYAAFAFDAANGVVTVASAVTGFVHRVKVYVNVAFTDAAATLEVETGTSSTVLAGTADIDATGAACYVVEVGQMVTAEDLNLMIAPGTSTAGSGYVVIEWI